MAVQSTAQRAWFAGRLIPLRRLARFEALSSSHRSVQVQVGRDTVFGTPAQALSTGLALVKAAIEADPAMAAQLHPSRVRAALQS
ncbi:MAG: hypothetical protein ACRDVE_07395 [Actinocrinis sp.]